MSKKPLLFSSIIIAILVLGCNQSYKKEYEELKSENEMLKESFYASKAKLLEDIDATQVELLEKTQVLRDSNEVLLDSIMELKWQCLSYEHQEDIVKPTYWLSEYDIENLQGFGFENPQKEIPDDLYKNQSLFSEEGILGGTMQVDSAVLIGSNWVLAIGSDGHILLHYLLEYTVEKNKKIKWKIIHKTNLI